MTTLPVIATTVCSSSFEGTTWRRASIRFTTWRANFAANQKKVRIATIRRIRRRTLGPFSIKVPKTWTESPPTGSMRLAQWSIGEKDPGELVLFNFPGGGSIDANINRWVGQFQQAVGR